MKVSESKQLFKVLTLSLENIKQNGLDANAVPEVELLSEELLDLHDARLHLELSRLGLLS